jgi:hypothetical protein
MPLRKMQARDAGAVLVISFPVIYAANLVPVAEA